MHQISVQQWEQKGIKIETTSSGLKYEYEIFEILENDEVK